MKIYIIILINILFALKCHAVNLCYQNVESDNSISIYLYENNDFYVIQKFENKHGGFSYILYNGIYKMNATKLTLHDSASDHILTFKLNKNVLICNTGNKYFNDKIFRLTPILLTKQDINDQCISNICSKSKKDEIYLNLTSGFKTLKNRSFTFSSNIDSSNSQLKISIDKNWYNEYYNGVLMSRGVVRYVNDTINLISNDGNISIFIGKNSLITPVKYLRLYENCIFKYIWIR